jgi:hypothetical protein
MTAGQAFRSGIRRVNGAPLVVAGLVGVTLLVALPLSIALRGMIAAHLGRSLAADAVASGASYDWWQEFSSQASGLGATFVPSIIGFGAVLDNVAGLVDNVPLASTIAGATAAWMVVWSFLSGGVIDRLARGRPTRAPGFFAACGRCFWRFVRLGAVAWVAYAVLFAYVHGYLFGDVVGRLTRDATAERTAFALHAAGYALFLLLLASGSLLFDYARIRIVVEDRRSALGSLAAAARFIRRRPGGTIGLYLLNAAAFAAAVLVYAMVAPGAPRTGASAWLTLAIGQLYIVARHYLKLVFYASQTAYFQGSLAHAAYTAAPPPVWPESPAADAIAHAADPRAAR